ncbi:hypothetical protein H0484_03035 [Pusillimonas sp. CC-YST705]|uniref:Uncharacterized protein n=1 Tax=Mesopusillimonas faecipullorum TaxID=2755040 RepID=A0ABS8C9L3_9BURK|nr:hypothetical protein [Mesopusillimonas faecipullorum]MCB5362729.1 hypothetical protein [Mesopusillimonas faecipullorum]
MTSKMYQWFGIAWLIRYYQPTEAAPKLKFEPAELIYTTTPDGMVLTRWRDI